MTEHNRAEKSKMMNDIKQQQQKQDKMMNEKDQHIDRSIEVNLIIVFGVSVLIHNSGVKYRIGWLYSDYSVYSVDSIYPFTPFCT